MKNYIITTRTESVWGELWNDTFKVRVKNSGAAVAKARAIIFGRLDGDLSGIREIAITKVSEV
nr:MAG TPA: hypothetical protein [Bacteriophage sp.]